MFRLMTIQTPRLSLFLDILTLSHALNGPIQQMGRFPAVDPLTSTSRILNPDVIGQEHYDTTRQVKAVLQEYESLKDIIAILGVDELSDESETDSFTGKKIREVSNAADVCRPTLYRQTRKIC